MAGNGCVGGCDAAGAGGGGGGGAAGAGAGAELRGAACLCPATTSSTSSGGGLVGAPGLPLLIAAGRFASANAPAGFAGVVAHLLALAPPSPPPGRLITTPPA